ncbi:ATP-binding protein [Streptomyces sp. NPDC002776]
MAPSIETRMAAPQDGVRAVLNLSIERHPDPDAVGLSKTDAAWPQRLRRIVRAGLTHSGQPDLIETAELLLTELATNALRHGDGRKVGVRVCLRGNRCVIEVNDGSPTRPELCHAALHDEGGRGLFLVECLAAEWGVSDDGTTTWCTLPLSEGLPQMQLVAPTAPVLRRIRFELPADDSAAALARLQARTLLTVLEWPGDQHHAIDVLHVLVDNAVQHGHTATTAGQRFSACLSITEAHELLVDVTDPLPHFPDFDQAVTGDSGRGLWETTRQGVELSWFLVGSGFDAKTVRAVLRPGLVEL